MMKFRRPIRLALLVACSLALASCGSDSSNNTSFRFIQASPDLPQVNLLVDGVIYRSAVDYKGGPGFLTVTPRTYEFGIEAPAIGEDGVVVNRPLLVPQVQKQLVAGYEYTVIAIGKEATGTVQPLLIENVTEDVPPGNVRLQFVHAAPDVPAVVDIYLTAVPALPDLLPDLSTQTPIAQVTYGQQPAPWQLVLPGRYVIRVTLAGSTEAVFESAEFNLSSGNDFLMVAVDNTAAGASPISLAVNSGFRTYFVAAGTVDILDKDSPSELRTVQVSPDAPAMNVVGTRPQEPAVPPATDLPPLRTVTFASALTYLNYTGYVPTDPDTYTLKGVPTSDPATTTPFFTVTGTLAAGVRTTLFTTGLKASINPLVLPGDVRPVFAEGRLRIVDASPASATVDVYILGPDKNYADADVTPTLQGFVLRSTTGYLPLFPRNYSVTFTVAGSKELVAAREVAATAGTVQTAVLVDAVRVDSTSTGKPAAVLLLDDRST
jgi:hypothetical protein